MGLFTRLLLVAAVAAGAAVGAAALSARAGFFSGGSVSVCIHQNGGALTLAGTNGCAAQDSAATLPTSSGTVANSLALDGRGANSFLQLGDGSGGGTVASGFLRVDCTFTLNGTKQDVAVPNFGKVEYSCGDSSGDFPADMIVSMIPADGNAIGMILNDATAGQDTATLHTPKAMLFTGGDGSMMIEGIARQASGGSTVSLRTWIAPESIGASSARYFDVLYDLTETG